jgi:ABC-type branched-subunit amino acid transport system ATPase component
VADPLLRVENLVRRFGGILATDNVTLDVARGELHAIIGPNGAGKTTLISQLTGQLLPHSGTIRLAGTDVSSQHAGAGALVSDHVAAIGFHCDRQCRAGSAGA